MKMNIANKLTILRIVMVPFFVALMILDWIPHNYFWALLVFVFSSFTDYLDGSIARKYNMITEFGKFLDPLADKILTTSALVCFVEESWVYGWIVITILAREFVVSGVRLVAAGRKEKIVIAADILGKIKTVLTMITIILILGFQIFIHAGEMFFINPDSLLAFAANTRVISDILMYAVGAITIISGISYIVKNKIIFYEED